MKRLPCVLALAGTLAGATMAVSGCSTMSPLQTAVSYNPSDGTPATSGQVDARNLLIVAGEEGGPGTLSGYLVNNGDSPVRVGFQTRAESESNAPPNASVDLAGREATPITGITFPRVDAPPGALTEIFLVTPAGKTLVTVPVMAPIGYYATLSPTRPAAPTAGPTATTTTTSGSTATTTTARPTATTTAPPTEGP